MKGQALAKARLKAVGFDPITIITILLPLVLQCLKPTPAKLRDRKNRPAIVRVLLKDNPGLTLKEARRKADAILDQAAIANDDELQALIDDAK